MSSLNEYARLHLDGRVVNQLVSDGLGMIRHSDLTRGRKCPRALFLSKNGASRTIGPHALLGSAFHEASSMLFEHDYIEDTYEFWQFLLNGVVSKEDGEYVHDGHILTQDDILRFAQGMSDMKCCDLIRQFAADLDAAGFVVDRTEFHMSAFAWDQHDDGPSIEFQGTADLVVSHRAGNGVMDIKTSGMWDRIVRGKSYKGQQFSNMQLIYMSQLRHYRWLLKMSADIGTVLQGIVFPVNLLPFETGPRKGQRRGPSFQFVICDIDFDEYWRNIRDTIGTWAGNGYYKAEPMDFGAPACPSCHFFNDCMVKKVEIPDASVANFIGDLYWGGLRGR